MSNWIDPKDELPKINYPVLCILRSKCECECEHYSPFILSRQIITHDGDYVWYTGTMTNGQPIIEERHAVFRWMHIPKFPIGFNEGFER